MSALPQRFRRPRLLIVGCGDVGMRILRSLRDRPRPPRIYALMRRPEQRAALRAAGAIPVEGDLDQARSLHRLRGLAQYVIHLAPPPATGSDDPRTRHLLARLSDVRRLVYVGTTGVYGNCAGRLIDETAPIQPQSERAQRRVAAERLLRGWGKRRRHHVSILRAPGIYARDRLPVERIQKGVPVFCAEEDVYTNHIHADDLARLCWLGLYRGLPNRSYNACDDVPLPLGDWFDAVARASGLPLPPRLSRAEVQALVSPLQWSFMRESRRIANLRLRREWRIELRYPQALEALLTQTANPYPSSSSG